MEFLRDDGISFCSFFEVVALEDSKKEKEETAVYLQSTEYNEKVMILYTKE